MILGSIIDSGITVDELVAGLDAMHVSGYSLHSQKTQRGGLEGTHLEVILDSEGKKKHQLQDFIALVEKSDLSDSVIERSVAVFQRLAEAESLVHGVPVEETHLHELGTLDTLVDVVGSVLGLEMLGINDMYCSSFPLGSGTVKTEHGVLPVPAPATAALFSLANAPVVPLSPDLPNTGEMVTPPGAAILTVLAKFERSTFDVKNIGYGLGTRNPKQYPNAMALWITESIATPSSQGLRLLETNIDDMSPEILGYVQEKLMEMGARDVWFTPIQMKKNRPAVMLSLIVPGEIEGEVVKLMMRETSTLGIRVRDIARHEAERKVKDIETSLGKVVVKLKEFNGETIAAMPEYESVKSLAAAKEMSLTNVFKIVQYEAEEKFGLH